MKAGWSRVRLGDLLDVQNGFAFDSKSFSPDGEMPLIRIRDLKEGVDTEAHYTGTYEKKYVVEAGDLLIGMDGEFGCYEWKGSSALLNQRVCRLQNFNNILLPRFLFYGINSYLKDIEEVTGFTTVKHLSSKQVLGIEFPTPPLSEQQRIVTILDEAFEGIATATANAKKNLANARELFASYLQNIRAEKQSLDGLVNITTGKLDVNASKEGGKYPFFTCSRQAYAIDTYAFDCEAILLAGNNASGDFNVKHYKGKFNAYQRTYVITVNQENRLLYRYLYFQMVNSLREFKNKSVGANTKFLKLGMINDLRIPMPSLADQQAIVVKLDELSKATKKLEAIYQKKLTALDELKKSILNQAFSGQLN